MVEIASIIPEWVFNTIILISVPTIVCIAYMKWTNR